MTSPSQEHLLGYLLGALEAAEHEQLENEIASDPRLAREVDQIARCLQPLECCRHLDPPPQGLAARTCNIIFAEEVAEPVTPARHGIAAAMSPEYGGSDAASSWRLADFVVAAGVFISAGMLFFPAIANSRAQAQLAQCQNNLRQFGQAMIGYSQLDPRQEYPAIPKSGQESYAGYTAVVLNEGGHLSREEVMLCPSSPLARERGNWRIPTRQEIKEATGDKLVSLRRMAGGSLALPLGYMDNDRYTLGRNESSESRVLAADAPTGLAPQLVSMHHDGQGENVVFESGRTAYVRGCGSEACGDAIYVNRHGAIRPGVDPADNVLAPPEVQPYPELLPAFHQN